MNRGTGPDAATAAPSIATVRSAARRLAPVALRTPVMTSRTLDDRLDARVFLKCETFQRTGSFKFRGAFNALARLDPATRGRGALTYSSGNHAQALALAGRLLRVPVTVVMPSDAPAVKRAATAGYGATIVPYDPGSETREDVAGRIALDRPLTLIPPFDHPDVISGQGTAALELIEAAGPLDAILAPCGGGGLLSGTAIAATSVSGCRVIGVEPAAADDAARSFRSGTLHRVRNPPTIADGLRTASLGEWTWPVVRSLVTDIVTVSESDIVEAMRFLWTRMKLVVEPSGAVALAGLLAHPSLAAGGRVGVIVSGGNVDPETACRLLAIPPGTGPAPDARGG